MGVGIDLFYAAFFGCPLSRHRGRASKLTVQSIIHNSRKAESAVVSPGPGAKTRVLGPTVKLWEALWKKRCKGEPWPVGVWDKWRGEPRPADAEHRVNYSYEHLNRSFS